MASDLLKDKVVIIAGGCGLLGKVFATSIIENQGVCIIVDKEIKNEKDIKNEIAKTKDNSRIEIIKCNIENKDSLLRMIDKVHTKYEKIDGFVNVSYPRNKNWGKFNMENLPAEDFNENIALHLGGYFLAAQTICNYFKKQGHGNLVQIASIQGVQAPKFDTYNEISINGNKMGSPVEYSIIKAGIILFTKYIAKWFKGCNIRSNCISPGGILDRQPIKFQEKYKKYCLSKGLLDPQDIVGTLIYLLSDMSNYVNGQNIIVDDGWSL